MAMCQIFLPLSSVFQWTFFSSLCSLLMTFSLEIWSILIFVLNTILADQFRNSPWMPWMAETLCCSLAWPKGAGVKGENDQYKLLWLNDKENIASCHSSRNTNFVSSVHRKILESLSLTNSYSLPASSKHFKVKNLVPFPHLPPNTKEDTFTSHLDTSG